MRSQNVKYKITGIVFFFFVKILFAQDGILIDDFEGEISNQTVDFGTGRGSTLEVLAERNIKFSGSQSIKVIYEAILGGYMWIARGYDLDVRGAGNWCILPKDIDWKDFSGISFYMYGESSKNRIAFDIKDNGNEMWRIIINDDFSGWKKIICPFQDFFVRADWQPENSDRNYTLDFPIKSFQFEPLPEGKGTLYFDCVELYE
jgi:hypothetical protein